MHSLQDQPTVAARASSKKKKVNRSLGIWTSKIWTDSKVVHPTRRRARNPPKAYEPDKVGMRQTGERKGATPGGFPEKVYGAAMARFSAQGTKEVRCVAPFCKLLLLNSAEDVTAHNYRYNDGFEKEQAFRLVGCHGMSKDHNGPDEVWNFLPGCGNCNGQVSTKDHYGWIELRCSQLSPPCPVTAEFRHRSAEFNFAKRNYLQSLKKLPSQEF